MEIRVRATGQTMFWNEFRDLLLSQNPGELIKVAAESEQWINDHGADIVFEGPQATGGTVYQYSMRQGVELIGDKWYTKYVLGPIFTDMENASAVEQETAYKANKDLEQASIVRAQRANLLKDSDWTQIADATVNKAIWANYRQQLRDVPQQAGFPWQVQWPTQPQ